MSEFVVEAFTNEFDQVINPGDKVIFAGYNGYSGTRINRGVFKGVRYADVRRYRDVLDADGNVVMEERYGRQYPKRETYTVRIPVAVTVEQVPRGNKYIEVVENGKRTWKKSDEIHYGTSTLPKMRVYKIDTGMDALVGKSL